MKKPTVSTHGDIWRFAWLEEEIVIDIDGLQETGNELKGDIVVRSQREPNPGLLHDARLNLSSSQAQRTLVKALEEREGGVDWQAAITQVCYLTRQRWREGDPLTDLRTTDIAERQRWLVEPYIEMGGPTVLYADGGTGKSIIALALAVSIATGKPVIGQTPTIRGPVLYLDWETDRETHAERMRAICVGLGVCAGGQCGTVTCPAAPIYYRSEAAGLPRLARSLRRRITEQDIKLVIVDSLGAARGGNPNEAEPTLAVFAALRSLMVPVLVVDHVSKDQLGGDRGPTGSRYTYNSARIAWQVNKAQEEGEDRVVVAFTNPKRNNGPLLQRHGYRIHYSNNEDILETIEFTPCDLRSEMPDRLTLKERIQIEMEHGSMTARQLADVLDAPLAQVKVRLSELLTAKRVGHWGEKWGLVTSDYV